VRGLALRVTAWWRTYRGGLPAELVLAFVVGAAAFLVAALVSAGARSHAPAALLGLLFIVVVLAVAHFGGVVYAIPVGLASIVAFDWYFLPPTHPLATPDAQNVFALGVFLVTSVLVGEVAARAGRRAVVSEEARGALAEEQAALRRMATQVARQASPAEVFEAVTEEAGRLLRLDLAQLFLYEGDGTATVVAAWSRRKPQVAVGTRLSLDRDSVIGRAFRTRRPARMDDYADAEGSTAEYTRALGARSVVGAPIVVEGRIWGLLTAASLRAGPLPVGTESRMGAFTELVATAIANAEARKELERIAAEQAALGRVATLVAEAVPSSEIFAAVAAEVAALFGVPVVGLHRYEPDQSATVIAASGDLAPCVGLSRSLPPADPNVLASLLRTGRPARIDEYAHVEGEAADTVRALGVGSVVGVPVIVDGRIWGAVTLGLAAGRPRLPEDTVERLTAFTDLVATAIANADARSKLTASRARVVSAADETRRRIERDLHDGIQQRLVSLALEVRAAQTTTPRPSNEIRGKLSRIADGLGSALQELREISRGIHPAVLSEGGLAPALRALARRSALPIDLDLQLDSRLDHRVEAAAYYVASEAVTNAVKHAQASLIELHVGRSDGLLSLAIRDDGIGGADPRSGSGLIGLTDRVEALGGTISVVSPAGAGTTLHVQIPSPA
jgi:signal transduction histidine kinase